MEKHSPGRATASSKPRKAWPGQRTVCGTVWLEQKVGGETSLCSTFAAKKQSSRPVEVPVQCFRNTAVLPSLHVELVQTAGPEREPAPPLTEMRPGERSQLGEVSWRTDMISGPRNFWKEPKRGGQDGQASGTGPWASSRLREILTLRPALARALQWRSQCSGPSPNVTAFRF